MFEKIDSGIFDGIQYEFCRNFSSLFFCGWGTAAELLSHEAIFVLIRSIFRFFFGHDGFFCFSLVEKKNFEHNFGDFLPRPLKFFFNTC